MSLPHEKIGEAISVSKTDRTEVVRDLGGLAVLQPTQTFYECTAYCSNSERVAPYFDASLGALAVAERTLPMLDIDEQALRVVTNLTLEIVSDIIHADWWTRLRKILKDCDTFDITDFYEVPKEVITVVRRRNDGPMVYIYNFISEELCDEQLQVLATNLQFLMERVDFRVDSETTILLADAERMSVRNLDDFKVVDVTFLTEYDITNGSLTEANIRGVRESLFGHLKQATHQIVPELIAEKTKYQGQWGVPLLEKIEVDINGR